MAEEQDNVKNGSQNKIKGTFLAIIKRPLIFIIAAIVVVLILVGSAYTLDLIDGKKDKNNPKNGPAAAEKFMTDVNIDENGNMVLSKTPQEFWDELLKKGNDITRYLSSAQELAKLLNAQIATEYLDTRPDPSQPIDWEAINKDVNSKNVQGIIKLKRRTTDNKEYYMTYLSPDQFNAKVTSGASDALNYFTLEKSAVSTGSSSYSGSDGAPSIGSLNNVLFLGDSILVALQSKLESEGAKVFCKGSAQADFFLGQQTLNGNTGGNCGSTFNLDSGLANITSPNAIYLILGQNSSPGGVTDTVQKIQTLVGKLQTKYPNVPVFINSVVPAGAKYATWGPLDSYNAGATQKNEALNAYCSATNNVYYSNVLNGYSENVDTYTHDGLHPYNQGVEVLVNNIKSNLANGSGEVDSTSSGTSSSSSGTSSGITGTNGVTSTSLSREEFIQKAQSYAPAISKGTSTQMFRDSAGIIYDICVKNNINPVLCAGQAWQEGNWAIVPRQGATYNYWGIGAYNYSPTATGYSSMEDAVQRYCDQINSQMNGSLRSIYQKRALEFSKYNSKFKGDMSTIYDVFSAYCWVPGTPQEEADGAADYIEKIIKCGTQIFGAGTIIDSVSGGGSGSSETAYTYVAKIAVKNSSGGITTQQIQYKNYMNKYTLPFDYLWAMLIIGDNKDFVFDLAELVYNSQFEITVHDNLTITTTEEYHKYKKMIIEPGETENDPPKVRYEIVTDTTKTVQNNYTSEVALTKADAWCVKYEQKYDYEDMPEQVTETDWQVLGGNTENLKKTKTTVKMYKYTSSPSNVEEKTDKNGNPNFVTVFCDNYDARSNILSGKEWLFDILESNEDTKDMVDLTKYLIYKATGQDLGFTDFDTVWKAFRKESFNSVSGIYGGTIQEKVWFALLEAGFSKESAAGVLGNIEQESGFNVKAINSSSGVSGMCQWRGDRKTKLVAYANSKGVDWTDEDTQVEYLIAELTPGGKGIATYQFSGFENYGNAWRNATDPKSAAEAFCWGFERCGRSEANMPYRQQKAQEYYDKFKELQRGSGGEYQRGVSSDPRIIGTFTSAVTGRTFTIFNQMQISGWGSCCNRASQISVCSGYYNGNPTDLIAKTNSACPGQVDLYNICGLSNRDEVSGSSNLPAQTIRNQIQGGGYIIVYLKGNHVGHSGFSKNGRKWASYMHWVAILGYRNENGKEEMFVSDSGHSCSGWMPIDEFDGMIATDQRSLIFINEK